MLALLALAFIGGDNTVFQEIEIVLLGCFVTLVYIGLQLRLRLGDGQVEQAPPEQRSRAEFKDVSD